MYTVWNRYAVSSGEFKGLILGGGFHHNSEAAYGGDFNHSLLNIPGFTVFDAMVGYDFKAFGRQINTKILGKNLGIKSIGTRADTSTRRAPWSLTPRRAFDRGAECQGWVVHQFGKYW